MYYNSSRVTAIISTISTVLVPGAVRAILITSDYFLHDGGYFLKFDCNGVEVLTSRRGGGFWFVILCSTLAAVY